MPDPPHLRPTSEESEAAVRIALPVTGQCTTASGGPDRLFNGASPEQLRPGERVDASSLLRDATDDITGVYVHVPFCVHKCHYCDFYSIVDALGKAEAYVDRLLSECASAVEVGLSPERIQTIFVGGGTPTLLGSASLQRLLSGMAAILGSAAGREWTIEANPETMTEEVVEVLAGAGVTRVSIGAQSFQPTLLKSLERRHDPASVARAVDLVTGVGIESFNIDMIFGIPGQTMADLESDISAIESIDPPHLSWYGLIYEPGTPLAVRRARGEVSAIDEGVEAAMYKRIRRWAVDRGYRQYEISAFCTPGHECRHNLLYWQDGSFWPLGPSAAGHVGNTRWRNVRHLNRYLDSSGLGPIEQFVEADADTAVGEAFMMGLRPRDGMPTARVLSLLEQGERGAERRAVIERGITRGDLSWTESHLRLTDSGVLIADSIISDLL